MALDQLLNVYVNETMKHKLTMEDIKGIFYGLLAIFLVLLTGVLCGCTEVITITEVINKTIYINRTVTIPCNITESNNTTTTSNTTNLFIVNMSTVFSICDRDYVLGLIRQLKHYERTQDRFINHSDCFDTLNNTKIELEECKEELCIEWNSSWC